MATDPTTTAAREPGRAPFESLPATLAPDPALMKYYALASLMAGPFFFVPLTLLYFRYHTLRYEVDDEGITMRWGILFRREISLNYARIQDIHLSSNVLERWLGLAKIQVQTASGGAGAEMTIEGMRRFQAMRDFLYSRMRGASSIADGRSPIAGLPGGVGDTAGDAGLRTGRALPGTGPGYADMAELVAVLRDAVAEVRALREALDPGSDSGGAGTGSAGEAAGPSRPPADRSDR